MDMKRIAIGAIVGAITLYVTGLLSDMVLADFYAANTSAAGRAVFKEPALGVALRLANLAMAALVTLAVILRRDTTIASGALTGAVVGFLAGANVSAAFYGFTIIWNLTVHLVFPLDQAVHTAIAGAVIVAVLARVPAGATVRPAE
jgi:hypothetical protein